MLDCAFCSGSMTDHETHRDISYLEAISELQSAVEPSSLNVLIISSDPAEFDQIRQALEFVDSFELRITTVPNMNAARTALQIMTFDAIFVSLLVNDESGPALLREFPELQCQSVSIVVAPICWDSTTAHAFACGASAVITQDEIRPGLLERTLQQTLLNREKIQLLIRRVTSGTSHPEIGVASGNLMPIETVSAHDQAHNIPAAQH